MTQDRFSKMVEKLSGPDEWGIEMLTATHAVSLLRRERRRVVRLLQALQQPFLTSPDSRATALRAQRVDMCAEILAALARDAREGRPVMDDAAHRQRVAALEAQVVSLTKERDTLTLKLQSTETCFKLHDTILERNRGSLNDWKQKAASYQRQLAQRDARIQELEAQYHDLIMQVGKVYPGESRHDTAKRYLRKHENECGQGGPVQATRALAQEETK